MSMLGIDTGGTFTDAVVYDDPARRVIATAKSPTTHDDLAVGITGAIDAALAAAGVSPAQVELVCLSTTLATNALVEGRGRGVALVIIGFDPEVLDRAGLADALGGNPVIFCDGGHNAHGSELAPFDAEALATQLAQLGGLLESGLPIEAYAVAAQFSVRNPAHERAAAEVIGRVAGRPVTCSNELSAQLNGPKRALTAVLNARLIPIIDELLSTLESAIVARGIAAPVMVVRGDGSLVSAGFVRDRPIETILSGPAASLVGAAHLSGLADAVVSDIGGTTTDIAVLRAGRPVLSAAGAEVGGHRTMVEAVAMHTLGLGGDSEVHHDTRSPGAVLRLGPRRILPVSQLAMTYPRAVEAILRAALTEDRPTETSGRMLVATRRFAEWRPAGAGEMAIHAALRSVAGPVAWGSIGASAKRSLVDRLVREGLIMLAGFTPTDACHVLGMHDHFDAAAARLAAEGYARRRDSLGRPIAESAEEIAHATVETVIAASAEAVLAAALAEDGLPGELVGSPLVRRSMGGPRAGAVVRVEVGLVDPLVGLGASAATYYPAVAERLRTTSVVPEHAAVANAVGAVAGRVTIRREAAVRSPAEGQFLVHLGDEPTLHLSIADARAAAEAGLRTRVSAELAAAGAGEVELRSEWTELVVELAGMPLFVEGTMTLTGSGRPDLARR